MSLTLPAANRPTVTAGFKLAPLMGPVMTTPANTTSPNVRLNFESSHNFVLSTKYKNDLAMVSILPDLNEVSGGRKIEGAAASEQDDEQRA